MTYLRTLGRSGLLVSPLSLGTMTFGNDSWGSDEPTSGAILDAYLTAGGNVIDTADVYGSAGSSEEQVGRLVAQRGIRDDVLLATKFGFSGDGFATGGAGRVHANRSLEASLRRLGTEHVDLYWLHVWDDVTPAAELVHTMADLVRAGKIRYWALSDVPAWFAAEAATVARYEGLPGPVALQVEYSLVAREVENEHVRMARELGLALVPWSPLAGGFLTGKYTRDKQDRDTEGGRLSKPNPFGDSKFTDTGWAVLDVLREVADEMDVAPAQVALAWVLDRPGVDSVLVGARTVDQLDGNAGAVDLELPAEARARLDDVSAPDLGFPAALYNPTTMAQVIGGGTEIRRRRG